MKPLHIFTFLLIVGILASMTSCIPQQKMMLMQYENLNDSAYANAFIREDSVMLEYKIQPNDYLYVLITTVEKDLSQFLSPLGGMNFLNETNQALIGYYVDDEGFIDFPYLGKIKVGGFSVAEAHQQVRQAAQKMIGNEMRVEVRLINNYINVLGEVKKEGIYNMTKNRVTIFEALSLAGGLTDYARRTDIKVFREVNGKNKVYQIDVTSGKLISGQMFYVFPNDVIYVEPMKAKAWGINPTFSLQVLSSVISTGLTILLLIQGISAVSI